MTNSHPVLIQGGMGIGVSNWKLANAVSKLGHLGVVSGTCINSVLVRRLQDGDKDGSCRRALRAFPAPALAQKIMEQYFVEGGKGKDKPYKRAPMFTIQPTAETLQLNAVAAFVEVFLAKEGHSNPVGINLLEKIHLPNLSALYGAMLGGVGYVIMGAGIPREIPGAMDLLCEHQVAKIKIPVEGKKTEGDVFTSFDPAVIFEDKNFPKLNRPFFLPIVSSAVLAASLKKKSTGRVDGFIVEGPLAGGHNAPPRGPMQLSVDGEPIYGERDEVDLADMKELGLPFWMAGHYATPDKLAQVQASGAQGIQVGTLFAFSQESGLDEGLRRRVVELVVSGDLPEKGLIFTDPRSSPTGFPFKAVRLGKTMSEQDHYLNRKRICDLGYLRHAYQKEDGSIGLRCPAEPVHDYVKKGGLEEETVGRKCLCNALFADIGQPQIQFGDQVEQPLLTAGDDLNFLARILSSGQKSYNAEDVIDYLFPRAK